MLEQEYYNQHKLLNIIETQSIQTSDFFLSTYILDIFVIYEVYTRHDMQQILTADIGSEKNDENDRYDNDKKKRTKSFDNCII